MPFKWARTERNINNNYASICTVNRAARTAKLRAKRAKSKLNVAHNAWKVDGDLEREHVELPFKWARTGSSINRAARTAKLRAKRAKSKLNVAHHASRPLATKMRRGPKPNYHPNGSREMTHDALQQWQEEQRKQRNREFAVASYASTTRRIQDLERDLFHYQKLFASAHSQIDNMQKLRLYRFAGSSGVVTATMGQQQDPQLPTTLTPPTNFLLRTATITELKESSDAKTVIEDQYTTLQDSFDSALQSHCLATEDVTADLERTKADLLETNNTVTALQSTKTKSSGTTSAEPQTKTTSTAVSATTKAWGRPLKYRQSTIPRIQTTRSLVTKASRAHHPEESEGETYTFDKSDKTINKCRMSQHDAEACRQSLLKDNAIQEVWKPIVRQAFRGDVAEIEQQEASLRSSMKRKCREDTGVRYKMPCMCYAWIECNHDCSTCSSTFRTRNVQVQILKSELGGVGLFTKEPIMPGTMVIKYIGKETSNFTGGGNFVVKYGKRYVDAMHSKCRGKYVNHCCIPNCHLIAWLNKNEETKLAIFSKEDIKAGQELTIHYGDKYLSMFEDNVCKCQWCEHK